MKNASKKSSIAKHLVENTEQQYRSILWKWLVRIYTNFQNSIWVESFLGNTDLDKSNNAVCIAGIWLCDVNNLSFDVVDLDYNVDMFNYLFNYCVFFYFRIFLRRCYP